ncbi:enoyl-CoA hydratase [Nocardioides sp. Root1257]|uniref:enoyl-CoA hydratase/isomerase family protein n=1 Tax=unclassified Nocardioides TaxID=2615069 RepID=UPI00070198E0|nr:MULTISPECIES: enoyl-CoA hydratase/isomerase family protein [unclassified Nocardioides]KQW44988.1 enoyl-CoA hydratase [Nocardioides sp. Root1257]KRC46008.1 enoyl-CoA hydratase [Nocardioides sp. Root224]
MGDPATELVLARVDGHVATVTLNQPERKNPLSDPMIRALTAAFELPEVRGAGVVVIRGAGGVFSAGGDIKQFHASLTTDASEQLEGTRDFREMLLTLESLEAVTVAVVEGPALGGGCGLTAACDYAIASNTAKFGCPEIKLGAFPMLIAPALVRAIGARATYALSVSGDLIDAQRALDLGLVSQVVSAAALEEHVADYIERANAVPADVLKMGKMAVRAAMSNDYRAGVEAGSTLRSLLFSSPAFHEGVNAFVSRSRS